MGIEQALFVKGEALPDSFVCKICTLILEDAIRLSTCDHYFCQPCLEKWFGSKPTCPTCRAAQNNTNIVELVAQSHFVRNLLVEEERYCPRRSKGCFWVGPGSRLATHDHECLAAQKQSLVSQLSAQKNKVRKLYETLGTAQQLVQAKNKEISILQKNLQEEQQKSGLFEKLNKEHHRHQEALKDIMKVTSSPLTLVENCKKGQGACEQAGGTDSASSKRKLSHLSKGEKSDRLAELKIAERELEIGGSDNYGLIVVEREDLKAFEVVEVKPTAPEDVRSQLDPGDLILAANGFFCVAYPLIDVVVSCFRFQKKVGEKVKLVVLKHITQQADGEDLSSEMKKGIIDFAYELLCDSPRGPDNRMLEKAQLEALEALERSQLEEFGGWTRWTVARVAESNRIRKRRKREANRKDLPQSVSP